MELSWHALEAGRETARNWDAEDVLQRPCALEEGRSGTRLGQSDISPAGRREMNGVKALMKRSMPKWKSILNDCEGIHALMTLCLAPWGPFQN